MLDLSSNTIETPSLSVYDEQLRGCIQCSMCSGVCPYGYLIEYPPSRIIAALRSDTYERVIASDTIWLCMSCQACTSVCPAQIPIAGYLMAVIKEELLLSGRVPPELQDALEYSQRYGNPLGESARKRTEWTRGMESLVPILGKPTREVDVLWFVGDYASYHPRAQAATQAFARLLHILGVNFGILGPEEQSDGDSQRLAGERGLFEMLSEKNGKAFRKYKFREIITTDPHTYNAIKNEYPKMGISYPVRHYTEFLVSYLDQLKPHLQNEIKAVVTFHDPCYLGRVNSIYDAPRELLSAIPGVKLVEMSHTRKNSLCCGGGGGAMWMDGFSWEKSHTRLSEWRVAEATRVKADILAVACPYEFARFEDAVKTVKQAEQLIIEDISELLISSIDHEQ
jgi:dimethylglycine catabolism B